MSLPTPTKTVQKLQTSLQTKAKAEPAFRFYALWDKVCRALSHLASRARFTEQPGRTKLLESLHSTLITRVSFPREIIQHAVWIYLRFRLSYRDVEELLAERGIDVSHETTRRWVIAFGLRYAQRLRAKRPKPSSAWHLDEIFVSIGGKRMYLWRAVDAEGEVLDILVQASPIQLARTSRQYRINATYQSTRSDRKQPVEAPQLA